METPSQLATRLREVLLDGKWITNTNFREQLHDLTWQRATQKVGSLNTIAALTFHVNYYVAGVLNVLKGGALEIRDKYSFDLPPIRSQQEWDNLRREFLQNAEAFVDRVSRLTEEQLDAPFVDPQYGDYRRNIEGIIEHAYYHLGQIVLLRKMLAEGSG